MLSDTIPESCRTTPSAGSRLRHWPHSSQSVSCTVSDALPHSQQRSPILCNTPAAGLLYGRCSLGVGSGCSGRSVRGADGGGGGLRYSSEGDAGVLPESFDLGGGSSCGVRGGKAGADDDVCSPGTGAGAWPTERFEGGGGGCATTVQPRSQHIKSMETDAIMHIVTRANRFFLARPIVGFARTPPCSAHYYALCDMAARCMADRGPKSQF